MSSEKSLEFYTKLGFKEVKRIERSYNTVVFMECGRIVLEIFIDSKHPECVSNPEAKKLRHISFSIDRLEEVVKIVECEDTRTDWFGRKFIFIKGLDGQLIELKDRKQFIESASYTADDKWVQEHIEQFSTETDFM